MKNTHDKQLRTAVIGLLLMPVIAWAQSSTPTLPSAADSGSSATSGAASPNPPVVGADQAWAELQTLVLAGNSVKPLAKQPLSVDARKSAKTKQAKDFIALADHAKKYREDFPASDKVKEARGLEVSNLLKAALLGDDSQIDRALGLLKEHKNDLSVPSRRRFEVAYLAEEYLDRLAKDRAGYLIAREASARTLIKEFPDEAGGYDLLLAAADEARDVDRMKTVAKEIAFSLAPFAAKARARIVTGRFDLVGKSLADVANTSLGRGNIFEKARGGPAILYTWDVWSIDSIAQAKEIESRMRSKAVIIGVCLDRDVAAAKAVAAKAGLTAEQYYNVAGPVSWLALMLKLNAPGMVYLTDSGGVITDVTVRPDTLTAKLNAQPGR